MKRRVAIAAGGTAAVAAAVVGASLAWTSGRGGDTHPGRIVVADDACASGWKAPRSGRTQFTVENTSTVSTYEVELATNNHAFVYGQVERLAPGTSATMDVVLPPGAYTFECAAFGGGILDSVPGLVTGPKVAGAHPFQPVGSDQMHLATLAYRKSLVPRLATLERDTAALATAVDAGKLAAARQLWLTAHLDYAQLGAAYDTFGPYNDLIDGRADGLPGGVDDPGFHGFLRLEYGLWHGQTRAQLVPVADALRRAVHGLRAKFSKLPTANGDVALRTHEILENTLQFELTGDEDEGSHTTLATAWANAEGTKLAFAAIKPLLVIGSPGLVADLTRGIDRLEGLLQTYRRSDGTWLPLDSLARGQRERLDSATSGLLEQLELVPDKLEFVEGRGPTGLSDSS